MRQAATRRQLRWHTADARLRRWPVRVVMRDRDRQDLAWRLVRVANDRLARAAQRFDGLSRRLERRDVRRVTAELRTRLVRADGRLAELVQRRRMGADARTRELAARLHTLSPLAVLGRGYAVCWDAARTRIIRSSQTVEPGDGVRVTLAEGELTCRVESRRATTTTDS
jgi:exodeoxyribonuclease VII large subunit